MSLNREGILNLSRSTKRIYRISPPVSIPTFLLVISALSQYPSLHCFHASTGKIQGLHAMIRSHRNKRSTDSQGMNTAIHKLGLFAAANEMREIWLGEVRSFPLPAVYHRSRISSTHPDPCMLLYCLGCVRRDPASLKLRWLSDGLYGADFLNCYVHYIHFAKLSYYHRSHKISFSLYIYIHSYAYFDLVVGNCSSTWYKKAF